MADGDARVIVTWSLMEVEDRSSEGVGRGVLSPQQFCARFVGEAKSAGAAIGRLVGPVTLIRHIAHPIFRGGIQPQILPQRRKVVLRAIHVHGRDDRRSRDIRGKRRRRDQQEKDQEPFH